MCRSFHASLPATVSAGTVLFLASLCLCHSCGGGGISALGGFSTHVPWTGGWTDWILFGEALTGHCGPLKAPRAFYDLMADATKRCQPARARNWVFLPPSLSPSTSSTQLTIPNSCLRVQISRPTFCLEEQSDESLTFSSDFWVITDPEQRVPGE